MWTPKVFPLRPRSASAAADVDRRGEGAGQHPSVSDADEGGGSPKSTSKVPSFFARRGRAHPPWSPLIGP
jgi:hypothetical protein